MLAVPATDRAAPATGHAALDGKWRTGRRAIATIAGRATIVRRATIVAENGARAGMTSSACRVRRTKAGSGRSAASGCATHAVDREAARANERLAIQRRLD